MAEPAGERGPTPTVRVYDGDEVDRYVTELHTEIDRLNAEVSELRGRLDVAPSFEDLEAAERALGRALLQAQLTADEATEQVHAERQRLAQQALQEREELFAAVRGHRSSIEDVARHDVETTSRQLDDERARILGAAHQEAETILLQAHQLAMSIVASSQTQTHTQILAHDRWAADAPAPSPSPPPSRPRDTSPPLTDHRGYAPTDDVEPVPHPFAASNGATIPAPESVDVDEARLILPPPSGPPVIRLNGNTPGRVDRPARRRLRRPGSSY